MINTKNIWYRKFINSLIYIFVFSLCFERLTVFGLNLDFVLTKISSFLLIFFSFFSFNFWRTIIKIKRYTFLLFIFFIILTISSYNNKSVAFNDFFDYLFFLNILILVSLVNVFYEDKLVLTNALFVFTFGNVALTFLYFLGIGQTFISADLEGRATIFGNNQNYLGISLALSSLFILYNLLFFKISRIRKIFCWISVIPVIYFMTLTGSRTAFLSFLIGIFLFITLTDKIGNLKKGLFLHIVSILLLVLIFIFQDKLDVLDRLSSTLENGDTANRDIIWNGLLYFFLDFIFLGVGKTGYLRVIGDLSPHNAFLEVFIYTGLLGLFFFLTFVYRIFLNVIVLYKNSNDFFPIIIFIAILGILLTGQFFDQKIIWFLMSCLIQNPLNRISSNG
jgi:O-antigen ligase